MPHLLEVKNLETVFSMDGEIVRALNGVSYYLDEGEIISIVGESGSGKSVTQLSGLQLIPSPPGKIVGGQVLLEGKNILAYDAESEEMRSVRGGKISMIFQEPMTSLNPVIPIGRQITESVMLHLRYNKAQAHARALELLKMVGIPDAEQRMNDYPHCFSGGMRQRIMIAVAMAANPKVLIADEPTTALDVTTQAQLLEMLKDLGRKTGTAILIVTHNLGIVARYAQRIYVMYAGRVVESGTTKEIFASPSHPYTKGLLKAIPRLNDEKKQKLTPIDGNPPNLTECMNRCSFYKRCKYKNCECENKPIPDLKQLEGLHYAACWLERDQLNRIEASENKGITGKDHFKNIKNEKLLDVKNLKVYFPVIKGVLRKKTGDIKAVDNVSFDVMKGETIGLVGESGCGKTTVAKSILRILEPTDGEIIFEGKNIAHLKEKELKPLRSKISFIFQDPFSSLDPRMSIGKIVGEPLKIHKLVKNKKEYDARVDELLTMVGLDPSLKMRVAHEFSGGQRQRVGIARALASNPSVIVCDEPVSALDVSIQAQIVNLLEDLQQKLGLTYIFIAHDLSVVKHISDRLVVMYMGRVVEVAGWKELYEKPMHPYTQALLAAIPIPDPFIEETRKYVILKGEVPSLIKRPSGCSFHNRCPYATERCKQEVPPLADTGSCHKVACFEKKENFIVEREHANE